MIIRADAAHCRGEAGLLFDDVVRALGGNFSLHVLDRTAKVSIFLCFHKAVVLGDRCLEIFSVDAGKLGRFFKRRALHKDRSRLAVGGKVLVSVFVRNTCFRETLIEAFPRLLIHEDISHAALLLQHRVENVTVRRLFVDKAQTVAAHEDAGLIERADIGVDGGLGLARRNFNAVRIALAVFEELGFHAKLLGHLQTVAR